MKRIAIIGSGDLGQQVAHYIHQDTKDKVVAFYDDFQDLGIFIKNIPVLGKINAIYDEFKKDKFDEILIAIGYNHLDFKEMLYNKLSNVIPFYKFIHSSTLLDSTAKIGNGTIIYTGCIIDQNVKIDDNVLINIGCVISHDSQISKHTFISPAVSIAGFVNIKKKCIIGINTTIIDHITIAEKTQLGGGSVVIKNIEQSGLYVGNPIRFIH